MSAPKHRGAAFFGQMSAAMTHEMKNVLAIMKESRGLMEDLMEINADIDFPHKDRFLKAMNTIKAQLERGVTIATRFNRFAHSPDDAVREVDCQEWGELIAHLCLRHARSKELELVPGPAPEPPLVIETDPFTLLEALHAGIEIMYACAPAKNEVTIVCAPDNDGARYEISAPGARAEAHGEAFAAFRELAEEIKATAELSPSGEGVRLTLPRTVS